MLLIVHRNAEKEKVLKEWQWLSSYPENAAERPLADLAAVYSVVFIALEDLPAVSHDLRIQPVEVATSQNTLRESERFVSCVVTRSDGRQVASTPKFLREPLVMAMAEGLVEEIKINPRSSKEMQELYKVVAPVSRDLGEQLLERVQRPRPLASNF